MIKIYHARRARSVRVIWLLEELGVPYELETMDFTRETLQSPAYLQLQPLGKIPVIRDGSITLFESGAIVEYLLEKYDEGRALAPAPATPERAEYLQWFHFGEASLAAHVSEIVRERFGRPSEAPVQANDSILALVRERLARAVAVVDRALSQRSYICGEAFTAADIMVSYGITMARILRELPGEFANVASYLERLKQRPGYQRAWG
jgi:glutathione S-transferase